MSPHETEADVAVGRYAVLQSTLGALQALLEASVLPTLANSDTNNSNSISSNGSAAARFTNGAAAATNGEAASSSGSMSGTSSDLLRVGAQHGGNSPGGLSRSADGAQVQPGSVARRLAAVGGVHALLLLLHNEACGVPHSRLVASALQVLQALLSAGADIQVSTGENACV